jgi:hypothetical protein
MPEENYAGVMQHMMNKCIDAMRNTMRFVLAYQEKDVQAILKYIAIAYGL